MYETDDDKDLTDLVKNMIYIIQDVQSIKTQISNLGGLIKIRIRCDNEHYEMALGSSIIKINKYKPE